MIQPPARPWAAAQNCYELNKYGKDAVTDVASAEVKKTAPETVCRLIYCNKSKLAAEKLDAELGNILRIARAQNTGLGTTEAANRNTRPGQDKILTVMRDATRGYGLGS